MKYRKRFDKNLQGKLVSKTIKPYRNTCEENQSIRHLQYLGQSKLGLYDQN